MGFTLRLIKPYPKIYGELNRAVNEPNTHVIILTSRQYKLQKQIEDVLRSNNIVVDEINMKNGSSDKGRRILNYLDKFPNLTNINVYDNRIDDIISYSLILSEIPNTIEFNIFKAENGDFNLVDTNKKR